MAISSASLFFPVYGDEGTVESLALRSMRLLESLGCPYEIIIVDDCSPDRSGEIADNLAVKYNTIRVIHNEINEGYGRAIRVGLKAAKYEWIFMLDGDDQYRVEEFKKLLKVNHHYDLIITFRYKKIYSTLRIFVSWSYNSLVRLLFRTKYRDISTGLRMVRKAVVDDIELKSTSSFIGAELAIKCMLKGYAVGEVGIQAFPRTFGETAIFNIRNVKSALGDMLRVYHEVFSNSYDLPEGVPKNRAEG